MRLSTRFIHSILAACVISLIAGCAPAPSATDTAPTAAAEDTRPAPSPTTTPSPSPLPSATHRPVATRPPAPTYTPLFGGGIIQFSVVRSPQQFTEFDDLVRDLFQINADGTELVEVWHDEGCGIDLSPDGAHLLYEKNIDGQTDIFIADAACANEVRLTESLAADTRPFWIEKGQRVAFISDRAGGSDLYAISLDGETLQQLTFFQAGELQIKRSADGSKIAISAFWPFESRTPEQMIIDTQGNVVVDFANLVDLSTGSPYLEMDWSKDGSRIVMLHAYHLYTMNADGTEFAEIADLSGENAYGVNSADPVFSPDGSRIAFTSFLEAGRSDIYVINADGSDLTRLTSDDDLEDRNPAWSRDGSMIAFTRITATGAHFQIWVVNVDGTNLRRVSTENYQWEVFPNWVQ